MQRSPLTFAHDRPHRSAWWLALPALFLAALLALVSQTGNHASGAGALVVIEDASQLGSGSFSGNVCYQVVRDSDGVTISEGCFSIEATIAAPEGLDTSQQYTIFISLADDNCTLLDDPRSGNGDMPFVVRVSCDAASMTATTTAAGPPPDEAPAGAPDAGAPVELTAWPPVYDLPTATILEPIATTEAAPMASPIPFGNVDQTKPMGRNDDPAGESAGPPVDVELTSTPVSTAESDR